MKLTTKNIETKIEELSGIKNKVLQDLLDYSDDPEDRRAYLEDIIRHGCSSGIVSDLIYYSDTCQFYSNHEIEIWNMLEDQSDDFGQSVFEMIANFNCVESVNDLATFKNLLAWYAYEEKSRELFELDFELEF